MVIESVRIQFMELDGFWRTRAVTISNNDQIIAMRMQEVKRQHPDRPVRAIDKHGELLNLM